MQIAEDKFEQLQKDVLFAKLIDMEDRMAERKPKQERNEKRREDTRVVALKRA